MILLLLTLPYLNLICQESDTFKDLRKKMVEQQIISRGIKNISVIESLLKVERHLFVPAEYREYSYSDTPLPIGEGQTISQPYIVALMTESLELNAEYKVLEIGTGSGYQAAILAELCQEVYTIEIVETLGNRAEQLLKKLGYENINIRIGDGYAGWEEYSPFDAIIVTCSPFNIPMPLKEQLKEGGKMIIPVGNNFSQELILLRKVNGIIIEKELIPVRFVPMVDSAGVKH